MITREQFVPDAAAREAVIATVVAARSSGLRDAVAAALETPEPDDVYRNAAVLCGDHYVMLHAANLDCVPLFRLAVDGLGMRHWSQFAAGLEFFLHRAAAQGAAGVIRFLVQRGADPNAQEPSRNDALAPLFWAIQLRHLEAVRALLEAPSIDPTRLSRRGVRAVGLAIAKRRTSVLAVLLASGVPITPDEVVAATGSRDPPTIDAVFPYVTGWNDLGSRAGVGPLHAAVAAEDLPLVARLVAAGADPRLPSRKRYRKRFPGRTTPLDYAEEIGDPALVALLA